MLQPLGVKLQTDALQLLQHHAAGNLLAARQELEKLALTHHGQWLDAGLSYSNIWPINPTLPYSNWSTPYWPVKAKKLYTGLDRLLQQDTEAVIIAWQLQKEALQLLQLQQAQQQGIALTEFFKKFFYLAQTSAVISTSVITLIATLATFLIQELACFDRAFKSGQLSSTETALAHLVTLFINPVPKVFSLQQLTEPY